MSLLMEALRKAEESKRKATKHSSTSEKLSLSEDRVEESLSETPVDERLQVEPVLDLSLIEEGNSDNSSPSHLIQEQEDSFAEAKHYVNDISRLSLEKQDINLETLDYEDQSVEGNTDFDLEPSNAQIVRDNDSHSSPNSESSHRSEGLQQRFNRAIEEEIHAPRQERSEFQRRQEDRMVAGAVFQAKKSHQGSKQRFLLIALVLLLLPCAAGLFWFYQTSLSPTTPYASLSNNPNQGFLDSSATDSVTSGQSVQEGASPSTLSNSETAADQIIDESVEELLPNQVTTTTSIGQASTQQTAPQVTINQESADSLQISIEPQSEQLTLPPSRSGQELTFNTSGGSINPAQTLSAATAPQFNIQLRRASTSPPDQISPSDLAYEQLQSGNVEQAQMLYLEALSESPTNRQAMLGLATTFEKQGDASSTQRLYTQMLRLNPRDPIALAGLSKLIQTGDPQRRETQLKALIEGNPGLASLRFELGNLLASQQRWTEAEVSYFTALANAKASNNNTAISPDYAFNLAVSLEQLQQPAHAYTYYLEAQELSQLSAPGFNTELLNQRLQYLEQQQP